MLATPQFNAINGLCGSNATPSAEDILEDIILAKNPQELETLLPQIIRKNFCLRNDSSITITRAILQRMKELTAPRTNSAEHLHEYIMP